MHELGIVMNVLEQADAAAAEYQAEKVLRVTMEVGEVSSIVPELFIDAFNWAKKNESPGLSFYRGPRDSFVFIELFFRFALGESSFADIGSGNGLFMLRIREQNAPVRRTPPRDP